MLSVEFVGVVEVIGDGVSGFDVGECVMGYMIFGVVCEKVCVDVDVLVKMLDGILFDVVVGLMVIYGMMLYVFWDWVDLKVGEIVVVFGVFGGVG